MSRNKIAQSAITIAIACLLGSGSAAFAQESAPDINELAGSAQFVVHSRVTKVEYRMSAAGANGQGAVPYTFVTYDVLRPIRGSAGASSFSLRYIGGPDGRGHFLRASNVPVFRAGDEDILFVRGNGASGCPLAGCIEGRFRVLNGAVYDGTGAPVQTIKANRVQANGAAPAEFRKVSFPAPAFDELIKNPEVLQLIRQQGMSVAEARRRYEAQAPATVEMVATAGSDEGRDSAGFGGRRAESGNAAPRAASRPMPVDSFLASVTSLPAAQSQAVSAFENADSAAQIAAPSSRTMAPPKAVMRSADAQRSAADIAEERAQPKDDPTITRDKTR